MHLLLLVSVGILSLWILYGAPIHCVVVEDLGLAAFLSTEIFFLFHFIMIVSCNGCCFKYMLSTIQETNITTGMDDNIPSALSKSGFNTDVVNILPRSFGIVAGIHMQHQK